MWQPDVDMMGQRATDPGTRRRQRDARRALGAVLVLGLLAPLRTGCTRHRAAPSTTRLPAPVRVDLAHDPVWRLTLLPGIGRLRAGEIVWDRLRHGPLESLEDLRRIRGIGTRTLRAIASSPGLDVRIDGRPVRCPDERVGDRR